MSTNPDFPVLLNVTLDESENHCDVNADIRGFRASSVHVSAWQDSLIVEMRVEDDSVKSYYLGEAEPKVTRRLIPLGFEINQSKVLTHNLDGKLKISVAKRTGTKLPAFESSSSQAA